jgi:hypothetical protein
MTTNKTRRSKKDKKKILKHDVTKKRHRNRSRRNRSRRNRRHTVSSWKNHYTYESDNDVSISNISNSHKGSGNIVNGLRDFLASKKK